MFLNTDTSQFWGYIYILGLSRLFKKLNSQQLRLGGLEVGKEVDDGRMLGGYNVHRFYDGSTEGPDFTTMQYINVALVPHQYT